MLWLPRVWLVALLLSAGCSPGLSSAVTEFEAGRAPEALTRLRALEPELSELPHAERLRYGLYRGLLHLSLGDVERSRAWIVPVKHALDRNPLLFSHSERGRLFSAMRSLGHMPGE